MARGYRKSSIVCIERELLESKAFRGLSRKAILVLMDFLGRRQMVKRKSRSNRDPWVIENNGQITFTYKEAERKGISAPAFRDALDQLADRGFINIAETRAGVFKAVTLYAISDRWRDYGTDRFVEKSRPRRKRLHRKIGFQKGHPYYPPKRGRE